MRKLPLIATRVKDAPTPATARPTSGATGVPYAMTDEGNQGDSSLFEGDPITITNSSEKTFVCHASAQWWDNFSAVLSTIWDGALQIHVAPTGQSAEYEYVWDGLDVTTAGAERRGSVASSGMITLAAGTWDFTPSFYASNTGLNVKLSLVVVEYDSTGESTFTAV